MSNVEKTIAHGRGEDFKLARSCQLGTIFVSYGNAPQQVVVCLCISSNLSLIVLTAHSERRTRAGEASVRKKTTKCHCRPEGRMTDEAYERAVSVSRVIWAYTFDVVHFLQESN